MIPTSRTERIFLFVALKRSGPAQRMSRTIMRLWPPLQCDATGGAALRGINSGLLDARETRYRCDNFSAASMRRANEWKHGRANPGFSPGLAIAS